MKITINKTGELGEERIDLVLKEVPGRAKPTDNNNEQEASDDRSFEGVLPGQATLTIIGGVTPFPPPLPVIEP